MCGRIRLRAAEALLWLSLVIAVFHVLACRPAADSKFVVDLTQLGASLLDGRWQQVPVKSENGAAQIVQPAASTLNLYVEVPPEAELVVDRVEPEPAAAPAVEVTSEATSQRLVLQRGRSGAWRASLEAFSAQPVRLRFQNPAAVPRRWTRPRLVAPRQPMTPVLEPAPRPAGLRPNVIVYVVDTLRADRLSVYGYERETSPNLAKLADRAALFLAAYAPGPHTLPSITSLFASRYASELSGRLDPAGPARLTLAEVFRDAGYQTAAFQANFLLFPAHGYARGFDKYRVLRDRSGPEPKKATAAQVQAHALEWLRSRPEGPFFLYLQTMDVHFPYDPPMPFADRFARFKRGTPMSQIQKHMTPEQLDALAKLGDKSVKQFLGMMWHLSPNVYDGCVAYADHEIGQFLEAIQEAGLEENTLIAVTSDHGEPLWQRGHIKHGLSLYEELVHIPMILWIPWQAKARRIGSIVSMRDLGPTLLDLAGVEQPTDFPGRSLLEPPDPVPAAFAIGEQFAYRTNEVLAWYARQGSWKLILDSTGSLLFDLSSDPAEEKDVRAEHPIVAAYLEALIRSQSPALKPGGRDAVPLDEGLADDEVEALEEALRSLGYVE